MTEQCMERLRPVPVGLNTVSTIKFVNKYKDVTKSQVAVAKGDELGWFQYGGSLNILLFESGRLELVST